MIISDNHKFVFVAIPKTGTRSIYQLCKNHYGFTQHQEHLNIVPDKYKDYKKFTIVRNPYDRFVSMWWSTCIRPDKLGAAGKIKALVKNPVDILSLLEAMQKNTIDLGPGNLFSRQSDYLNNTKFDFILHTENLKNEIKNLPFILPNKNQLGNLNSTVREWNKNKKVRNKNPWEYINETALELINEYYASDFELLKEYPKHTSIPDNQ